MRPLDLVIAAAFAAPAAYWYMAFGRVVREQRALESAGVAAMPGQFGHRYAKVTLAWVGGHLVLFAGAAGYSMLVEREAFIGLGLALWLVTTAVSFVAQATPAERREMRAKPYWREVIHDHVLRQHEIYERPSRVNASLRARLRAAAPLFVVLVLLLALVAASGCSVYQDDRGIGDAPTDQQPDEARKVWPNADRFPNISAFCIGGNGVYTTTRQAPPAIVVDDPECGPGGALAEATESEG